MPYRYTLRGLALSAIVALSACSESNVAWLNANGVLVDAPTFVGHYARQFRRETITVVNFEFDSDALDTEAMDIIREQAAWIVDNPEVEFSVTGHADRVGNEEYNLALGQRRAERVLAALVELGVEESRLIAQVSLGEESPLVDTDDRERTNRRVVTEVLGLVDVGSVLPERRDRDDDDPEEEEEEEEEEDDGGWSTEPPERPSVDVIEN